MYVEGDYAYLDDVASDLYMFLVSDATNPIELATYEMSGYFCDVIGRAEFIFVSSGEAGLQIFENLLYDDPTGGVAWQQQSSGTTDDLWSVYFTDEATGWTVGEDGTILKTTDGGENWLPRTSGTESELFCVFFIDETTGWVVGRGRQ